MVCAWRSLSIVGRLSDLPASGATLTQCLRVQDVHNSAHVAYKIEFGVSLMSSYSSRQSHTSTATRASSSRRLRLQKL